MYMCVCTCVGMQVHLWGVHGYMCGRTWVHIFMEAGGETQVLLLRYCLAFFLRQGVVSLQNYLVIVYAFLNLIQMVVPGSVSIQFTFMTHDHITVLTILHFAAPYQQLLVHTLFPLSSHQDSLSVEMHPFVYLNLIKYYLGCS